MLIDPSAHTFWRKNPDFLSDLASYLEEKRVLEVYSGNGYLASELASRGVSVQATSVFSSHDAHDIYMYHEVEEMESSAAVGRYGDESDVLLMSWPVSDETALGALLAWGASKPVVFIGEVTRKDLSGLTGLGGCASDLFFEVIDWSHDFSSYKGNMLERAGVLYLNAEKLADAIERLRARSS